MKIIQLNKNSANSDWDKFFEVPRNIYSKSSIWVAEDSETVKKDLMGNMENKSRYQVWPIVAIKNNIPCARGVAILPPSKEKIGWIGYLEIHRDYQDEGAIVISELEAILINKGVTKIAAPKTNNMYVGLQISDFNSPQTIMTPHNPDY